MPTEKIAITLESTLIRKLDQLVEQNMFPNRSKAIQAAVAEKISKLDKLRLARECEKLDPEEEVRMAEAGMAAELESWPEY